ncbi:MAG: hypothetical protein D4R44_04075 [Actinobacteria bacterium]|nr:MAG: hypothetical protein D4R44_04075 [Actinomycetota bacterium]
MKRSDLYLNFIQSLTIRTRDRQRKKLILNTTQLKAWKLIADRLDRRERLWFVILKARREGISTLIEALMVAKCAFEDLVHCNITAHERPATKRIWEMAELMIKTSPLRDFYGKLGTKLSLGNSWIDISTAGSSNASRSSDLTCFHASEVAFWPTPDAYISTLQALPDDEGTICALESTANGKVGDGELFYDEWQRAESGESNFIPLFLSWWEHDEYRIKGAVIEPSEDAGMREEEDMLRRVFSLDDEQIAWRRWCLKNKCLGNLDKFYQEYPATAEEAFVQSGLPFFRSAQLIPLHLHLRKGKKYRIEKTGKLIADQDGPLTLWKVPKDEDQEFIVGADSSMGLSQQSRSRSAAQILLMDTMEQCGEYEAASAPHVFAQHLVGMAKLFNDALIIPEVQSSGGGGGRELIVFILGMDYFNMYRKKQVDSVSQSTGQIYGWSTDAQSRPRMIARIREVIDEKSAMIHSIKLVKQLGDFGENEAGRLKALSGRDDLLFAWGIALMGRFEYYAGTIPQPVEPQPDWSHLGIKNLADIGRVLVAHREKVTSGESDDHEPESYLEL